MKRTELLRRITRAAADKGVPFGLAREGADHSIYRCGGQQFSVPRHHDVAEGTARDIMRKLQPILGREWWK